MKRRWAALFGNALANGGYVTIRLEEEKPHRVDGMTIAITEMIAHGYLEPVPALDAHDPALQYRMTAKGHEVANKS